MDDIIKWVLKIVLNGIVWVFILSISWNERTMFTRANEFFVQNAFVEAIDEELADLWFRLSETAKITFSETRPEEEETM